MCFWPPMPIATQAAGVRCICLIIIRLDRGVLKMKETNHRAPLSKVCLPGWGVLDLSPLSSLSLSWHPTSAPPPPLLHHTHTQSLTFPQELPPQSIFTNSERSCTAPPLLLATPLIHSQLQNCRNTPHPHILKDFRLSPLFFFFLTPSQAPPTNHQLAACLTHLPPPYSSSPSSASPFSPLHPPCNHFLLLLLLTTG